MDLEVFQVRHFTELISSGNDGHKPGCQELKVAQTVWKLLEQLNQGWRSTALSPINESRMLNYCALHCSAQGTI